MLLQDVQTIICVDSRVDGPQARLMKPRAGAAGDSNNVKLELDHHCLLILILPLLPPIDGCQGIGRAPDHGQVGTRGIVLLAVQEAVHVSESAGRA